MGAESLKLVFTQPQQVWAYDTAAGQVKRIRFFDYDEFISVCRQFDSGAYVPIEEGNGAKLTLERQLWLNLAAQSGIAMYVKPDAPFLHALRQETAELENESLHPPIEVKTAEKTSVE